MSRVWGRVPTTTAGGDAEVLPTYAPSYWTVVETDATGNDDYVNVTALIQCLRLNLGESPFFGNFGIPAAAAVRQQLAPDYAVAFIQSYYSKFFASLIVAKSPNAVNDPAPTYNVYVTRHTGGVFEAKVAL